MYRRLLRLSLLLGLIGPARTLGESPQQYIAAAREGLALLTSASSAAWRFGSEEDWFVDLDVGAIELRFADGMTATAPIQVVGTYNTADGTFLWGWDHPSIPAPLREHALLAKGWGAKNRMPAYTSRKVTCTEKQAWDFTAVAVRLGKASGAYRGSSGRTLVFMTFGEVKLQRTRK